MDCEEEEEANEEGRLRAEEREEAMARNVMIRHV